MRRPGRMRSVSSAEISFLGFRGGHSSRVEIICSAETLIGILTAVAPLRPHHLIRGSRAMTADVAAAARPKTSVRRILIYLLIAFILITLLLWQTGALRPQPKVALVTASSGPYWD